MKNIFADFYHFFKKYELILLTFFAANFSFAAAAYYFRKGELLLYGDAESHLNISKRIIDSLTPGFAQLGGIWLPLPHLLLVPLVASNYLWHTALAGAIVSGVAYVISAICIYKITLLLLNKRVPAFFSFLIFACNPNILYMQTTALTELPLIAFSLLSIYFFFTFLKNDEN